MYGGANNGALCYSGVVPTLNVTVNDNNGNSRTWTYVNNYKNGIPAPSQCLSQWGCDFTVVETDPATNQTVHSFVGEYQTQVASYEGGCPTSITGCRGGGTLLNTVQTCYGSNGSAPPVPPACAAPGSVPTLPITERDVYTSFNGGSSNLIKTTYDNYGNVTSVLRYGFGATTPASQTYNFYGQSWSGSSCSAYPAGSYIYDTVCYSHTENSAGADVSKTQITYSNTHHPTRTQQWVSSSNWLTSHATYNPNGTIETTTDANGAL